MSRHNPYRFVGEIVTGDAFVGRSAQVRTVRSCWQSGGSPSNLSVQGSHRMGKSSFVMRAVELDRGARPELIFVRISVGDHQSGDDVLRAIVKRAGALYNSLPPELTSARFDVSAAAKEVATSSDWYGLEGAIKDFFAAVARSNVCIALILDEFDRAAVTFTNRSHFQVLRTLASESNYATGLITISRRPVDVIEKDAVGGSTLDGVLSLRCYAECFGDPEIDALLGLARWVDMDLRPARDAMVELAGGHPYLLGLLCRELVGAAMAEAPLVVAAAYLDLENQFHGQFKSMWKALDAATENRAADLLALILRDRQNAVRPTDLTSMRRLGILSMRGDNQFFSNTFRGYVAQELG